MKKEDINLRLEKIFTEMKFLLRELPPEYTGMGELIMEAIRSFTMIINKGKTDK